MFPGECHDSGGPSMGASMLPCKAEEHIDYMAWGFRPQELPVQTPDPKLRDDARGLESYAPSGVNFGFIFAFGFSPGHFPTLASNQSSGCVVEELGFWHLLLHNAPWCEKGSLVACL